MVNACKSLSKQLQAEMLALPKLHQPLADVALAALRRAGRDKEDDEPCKVRTDSHACGRQECANAMGSMQHDTLHSLTLSVLHRHLARRSPQSTVERSRSHLQRLVEQEEQLGALLEALSSAQTAASSGALQPDVNWAEYIGKLVADIEVSAGGGRDVGRLGKGARGNFAKGWRI